MATSSFRVLVDHRYLVIIVEFHGDITDLPLSGHLFPGAGQVFCSWAAPKETWNRWHQMVTLVNAARSVSAGRT